MHARTHDNNSSDSSRAMGRRGGGGWRSHRLTRAINVRTQTRAEHRGWRSSHARSSCKPLARERARARTHTHTRSPRPPRPNARNELIFSLAAAASDSFLASRRCASRRRADRALVLLMWSSSVHRCDRAARCPPCLVVCVCVRVCAVLCSFPSQAHIVEFSATDTLSALVVCDRRDSDRTTCVRQFVYTFSTL